MNFTMKLAGFLTILALAACTNANRFDNGADGFGNGAVPSNGAGGFDASAGVGSNPLDDTSSPQYFAQTVGDRVFFETDQATLTTQARTTLEAQAGWLRSNPDYMARIEGHADEQGTREYNIGLSNRRASAVRDYLVSQGIASNRLSVVGFGKERPVAVCSNESCYSQNRRAITILVGGLVG